MDLTLSLRFLRSKRLLVLKELYEDVNVNLEKGDAEITDANQRGSEQQNVSQELGFEQEEEDAYVTLTPTYHFIASLIETLAPHATAIPEITFGFTKTTPPPPSFFNPPLQQQTPTITTLTFTTTITTNPTVTLPEILNFASVFKFDQRISALESKMSELKQTNQFVKLYRPFRAFLIKKLDDEEIMDDKEDDEVLKELYEDVNVNLEKGDAEIIDANQRGSEQQNVSQELGFKQEEEDAYVTLTPTYTKLFCLLRLYKQVPKS
nr:hypothetical protein [Tanacetum cinerariifolium]